MGPPYFEWDPYFFWDPFMKWVPFFWNFGCGVSVLERLPRRRGLPSLSSRDSIFWRAEERSGRPAASGWQSRAERRGARLDQGGWSGQQTGNLLAQAKKELEHGEFEAASSSFVSS